jgi:hypothetical protein
LRQPRWLEVTRSLGCLDELFKKKISAATPARSRIAP